MKQTQKIITGAIALLAIVGIIIAATLTARPPSNNPPVDNLPIVNCPIEQTEDTTTVTYAGIARETALATLQGLCTVTLHPTYDGFVTGIEGHDAGDTHYWAFYINDAYATEGAGTYIAQEGDQIKWVLTSLDAAF